MKAREQLAALRRRALVSAALAVAGFGGASISRAQPSGPLKLGLAPLFSPATMVRVFRPMRDHLARALDMPVEAYTARDQRDLLMKTRAQEYDVVFIPANFAQIACTDWSYAPIAGTLPSTPVLLLVRADGPIRRPEDLKGKRFGGSERLGLVTLAAFVWLRSQGLDPDRELEYVTSTGNALLHALARGELDACALSGSQLLDMPADTPRNYRVMQEVASVPSPVYVAREALGAPFLARLLAAFLSFEPIAGGARTASNTKMRPLTRQELETLEPYAIEVRRALLR